MTPLVLFGLLVLLPVVVSFFFRVNAAVLFMSLCVGEILVQYVSNNTGSFVATIGGHNTSVSESTLRLLLLFTPAVLTAIFMFHTIHGSMKLIFNILPAIGTGLVAILLVKPLLSSAFQKTLENSSLWHQLSRAQAVVVAVSAACSLFFLWSQRHGASEHKRSTKFR